MSTIQFSNGVKVNFSGNPTQADVEEVARKLGITGSSPAPAPTEPAKPSFSLPSAADVAVKAVKSAINPFLNIPGVGDFAQNAARSVAEPLIRTGGAIESGLDKATGTDTASGAFAAADKSAQQHADTLAGHVGDFIGNVAPYFVGLGEEQAAAKAAELGLGKGVLPKIYSYIAKNAPDLVKNSAVGAAQTGDVGQGALIGAAGEVTKPFTSLLGSLLTKSGDKVLNSVIKPTQKDIKDGFSIETIKKHDLGGSLSTMFNKAETKLDGLSTQLSQKLASSPETIDLNQALKETQQRLGGAKKSSFGSLGATGNALDWLKNEINAVGANKGQVSIPDAQIIKRATGHYGAWTFGHVDPEATARQNVANTFYNVLKNQIEQKSPPGVREINAQISELIPVVNAIVRRIPVAERNNAVSLTDFIGLAASSLSPQAIPFTILNFLTRQGAFGQALLKSGAAVTKAAPVTKPIAASLTRSTTSQ